MLLSQGQASRWTRPFALCLPIRLTFCPIPTSPPWVQIGCPVSGQAEPRQPQLRPDPGPPADLPFSQSPLAKKLHTAEPDSGGEERREEAASPEAAFTPSARPPEPLQGWDQGAPKSCLWMLASGTSLQTAIPKPLDSETEAVEGPGPGAQEASVLFLDSPSASPVWKMGWKPPPYFPRVLERM